MSENGDYPVRLLIRRNVGPPPDPQNGWGRWRWLRDALDTLEVGDGLEVPCPSEIAWGSWSSTVRMTCRDQGMRTERRYVTRTLGKGAQRRLGVYRVAAE